MMLRRNLVLGTTGALFTCLAAPCHAWVAQPSFAGASASTMPRLSATTLYMSDSPSDPVTFREAEVLGLRLMQEGDYQGALDGTSCRDLS